MIDVRVKKDVKVGLVDGRGGRRGGNWSRNEQNATFKTPWAALSAAALRSGRNASRVRGAVDERPCMDGRTARRPPVNGTSPKTPSAGLALLLLAKKERLTPADWRLASSLRRAPGRRPRWFDDVPGASNDSRVNKIHHCIRLILCASRDAPHISPASVILMISLSTANTAPHVCHHSGGVTSTVYYCCFKKRKRDPTKKQHVSHPSLVWACALDPASEKRSWLPTCLLSVLLLLAGSRTTSGFPTAMLPLSSCLGCIPPLIGLPFLRFYAIVSSLFLLFVFFISFVDHDDVLCWLLSCPFSSVCFPCLSPKVFPVWFRLVPSILWPRLDSMNSYQFLFFSIWLTATVIRNSY